MRALKEKLPLPHLTEDKVFSLYNLIIQSEVLKETPFKDTTIRHNFVLSPRHEKQLPVIFHLSGYFGNGDQQFNRRTLEENFPQRLIRLTKEEKIPMATHVFVDAATALGGSQFINSEGFGPYGDYIQKELCAAVMENFSVKESAKNWVVMGGSSGGYGALHHLCQKNSPFGTAIAVAPDSHFESSLLPDLRKAASYLHKYRRLSQIQRALQSGELQKIKNPFHVYNALAMSLCYGKIEKGEIDYPLDLQTGVLNNSKWAHWKKKDPMKFLLKNKAHLKGKRVCLDVGAYDEYCLYFGARQIRDVLHEINVKCTYSEFEGGHRKLSDRKELALIWLSKHLGS